MYYTNYTSEESYDYLYNYICGILLLYIKIDLNIN